MENKIYNDDVERIVNDPERQAIIEERYHKRIQHQQRKMMIDAILYSAIAVAFGALGIIGFIDVRLAFPVCTAVGIWSAFCFGRFFENGKVYGWH